MFNRIHEINKTSQMISNLGTKHKLIGENIANVDTPGYTKKVMSFSDYMSVGANNLEKKINDKFGASSQAQGIQSTGKSVNMAEEIVEMQQNSLMYSIAVRRMSEIVTELKTAINVGR